MSGLDDALRTMVQGELKKRQSVGGNRVATVSQVNDDGTIYALVDGMGILCTINYPVVPGQQVIVMPSGQGTFNAVPTQPVAPTFDKGTADFFTGGVVPFRFACSGSVDPASFGTGVFKDIVLEQAGDKNLYGIITPLPLFTGSGFGFAIYSANFSPNGQYLVISSGFVDGFGPSNNATWYVVVYFLGASKFTAGASLAPTINLVAFNPPIFSQGQVTIPAAASPNPGFPLVAVDNSGNAYLQIAISSTIRFYKMDPSGGFTLLTNQTPPTIYLPMSIWDGPNTRSVSVQVVVTTDYIDMVIDWSTLTVLKSSGIHHSPLDTLAAAIETKDFRSVVFINGTSPQVPAIWSQDKAGINPIVTTALAGSLTGGPALASNPIRAILTDAQNYLFVSSDTSTFKFKILLVDKADTIGGTFNISDSLKRLALCPGNPDPQVMALGENPSSGNYRIFWGVHTGSFVTGYASAIGLVQG